MQFSSLRRAFLSVLKLAILIAAPAAVLAPPALADGNGYLGGTVNLTYYRPTTASVLELKGDQVVGAGLEYTNVLGTVGGGGGPAFDLDVSGNQITITFIQATSFDPNTFSGPVIANVSGVPNIVSASYNAGLSTGPAAATLLPGGIPNSVGINLQNLSYALNDVIVIDVTFNDVTAPAVASIAGSPDPVQDVDAGSSFTLDITFDEDMNTGVAPTVTFPTEDPSTTLSQTAASWTSSTVYQVTYSITDVDQVLADIDVRVADGQDTAGNTMTAATTADVFDINMPDAVAPTVAITGPVSTPTSAFTVTFTFSEDVTGFALGDIAVGNGAASSFAPTSATEYTALITPVVDGLVTVDVAGSVAQDTAGNNNTAAPQFQINVDITDRKSVV